MNEIHKYTYYVMFQSYFLDVSSMYVESVSRIVKNNVEIFSLILVSVLQNDIKCSNKCLR
jgi:hypothetical protein